MARWSPTTPISTGPTLGDILAQGVNDYFDRRDRNRELERQHKREDVLDAQRAEDRQYAQSQRPLAEALSQRTARQEGVVPHEAGYSLADALGGGSLGIGGAGGGTQYDSPLARPPEPLAPQLPRLGTFDTKTGTFVRQLPPPTEHAAGVQHLTDAYDYDPAQDRGDPRQAGALAEIQARHEAAMAEIERRAALEQGTPARRDPVADHAANRDYDISHPLPTQGGAGANPKLRQVPSAAYAAYSTNQTQLRVLQRAIDGLKENPGAVGLKGYVPGAILNRIDAKSASGGVGVRADIADVGSLKIHERSGAAVTASEFPRLKPFIPSATDDAKTATVKLQRMKEILQEETDAMASFYTPEQGYKGLGGEGRGGRPGSGSDVNPPQGPGGGAGDIDLRTPTSSGVSQDELAKAAADLARIRAQRRKP